MIRYGILIASDRGARGERQDLCAAEMRKLLAPLDVKEEDYRIVPDEADEIVAALVEMADKRKLALVLCSGGTGVSPRDVTPEAAGRVIERFIPGIPEAMRAAGLRITPHAMLSRAVAGIRGQTLIITLPGSPKAVRENLEVILPALPHALDKIQGDPTECGGL